MSKIRSLFLAVVALIVFGGQTPMTMEIPSDPYVITLAPHQVSRVVVPHSYETIIIRATGGFDLYHSGDAGDSYTVEQIDGSGRWMPMPATGARHEGGVCQDPCVFVYGDPARGTSPTGSNVSVGAGPVPGSNTYYVTPKLGKSSSFREIQVIAH
jgi:hypothetical protein